MERVSNIARRPKTTRERGNNTTVVVTPEEVEQLKVKKHQLTEEIKIIRSKIARTQVQTKRGGKPTTTNRQLYLQLARERQALENLIQDQMNQLAELRLSDNAAVCYELQEESKLLHQEKLRLKDEEELQKQCLEDSQRELDALLASDGPDVLTEQQRKMADLEARIAKFRHANIKLKAKLRQLEGDMEFTRESEKEEIAQAVDALKRQIAEVKNATVQNRQKFRENEKAHTEFVTSLTLGATE
jgi:DNA repair exonuclease SbcCD ATPase subunit